MLFLDGDYTKKQGKIKFQCTGSVGRNRQNVRLLHWRREDGKFLLYGFAALRLCGFAATRIVALQQCRFAHHIGHHQACPNFGLLAVAVGQVAVGHTLCGVSVSSGSR